VMTCATAPYRQVARGLILLAMLGMACSLPLRGMKPTTTNSKQITVGKLGDNAPTKPMVNGPRSSQLVGRNKQTSGGMLADNVMVYGPRLSPTAGSLILLMGYHGNLAWTLTEWWYLHSAWHQKDQEWCKDKWQGCVFDNDDKANVQYLTNNLRIVDAVGNILLDDAIGHAWFDYTHWPDGAPIADELDVAVANVFQLIEREYKIVGDYKRIAIAGMSQGADLALEVGIRFPHQLGMVVSQRGVFHLATRQQGNQTLAGGIKTPFILTAGDADELSPVSTYAGSCAALQHMQAPVYLKMFEWLDHGSFSKPEWELLIQAFSLMLWKPSPENLEWRLSQIQHLTSWSSCAPV